MKTKHLKQFDLQAALNGEAVMLRDGSKAFVRHHETEVEVGDHWRLWGVITTEGGSATPAWWPKEGRFSELPKEHYQDIIGMWPKTRIINGFEVPAPETTKPERNAIYFATDVNHADMAGCREWDNDAFDTRMLERGLVFLTKEDAIANAKAMLGINPYEET